MPLTLKCKDCPEEFTVEDGEIAFLKEKFGDDFKPPVRCKPCRKAKKDRNQTQSNNTAGGHGGDSFGFPPDDARHDDGQRHSKRTGRSSRGKKRQRY